jgi:hypothetical protein
MQVLAQQAIVMVVIHPARRYVASCCGKPTQALPTFCLLLRLEVQVFAEQAVFACGPLEQLPLAAPRSKSAAATAANTQQTNSRAGSASNTSE